ncbi:MAG: hypothetical protein L6R48_10420 [Planctomycetes bacterium]|nr:hypothetical protein [Planctomycetota bacterium]
MPLLRPLLFLLAILLTACTTDAPPRPVTPPGASPTAISAPAADHFSADLATAANMGFADDQPGDGVGGWSDQGRDNAFPDFPHDRPAFAGVPFRVLDPQANHGRAVLTLRHPLQLPRGPERASLPLPAGAHGRYLYLLHAACFGPANGATVGTVAAGGATAAVVGGRDLADWWNPSALANGALAAERPNGSALVGVYVSRFDLGQDRPAGQVEVSTSGAALWIVLGATLSTRDLPLPERRGLHITAGAEWRAAAACGLAVQAGSALDLSALVGSAPAGSRGRIIARPDGSLACAGDPATPVRFLGCSYDLRDLPHDQAGIEALAEATRRQGYNLVRFHFLDAYLAKAYARWGAKPDPAALAAFDRRAAAGEAIFDPEALDTVDRLVAALKQRGIYLYVDAMSSWAGYYPVSPWMPGAGGVEDLNGRLLVDPAARAHWRDCVRALLTRTNPYTGTRLADDPQVAVVLGFNEMPGHWPKEGPPARLLGPWRAFLATRFADAAAWRAAWNHGEAVASFEQVPLFAAADIWHDRRRALVGAFLNRLEEDTAGWMEAELRGWGYQGLFTQFDWLYHTRLYLARARGGAVSMHGYFGHPSNGVAPGSTVVQTSSLTDALGWWRGIASARIAGLPLLVTEYGQVFWNRHRYEEGLAVGAYAAFQDASLLTAHSGPVQLVQKVVGPFNVGKDPVARASQVVTALAFTGRAVAVAPRRIDLALTRAQALDRPDRAISGEQTRLGLLAGLAVAVEGHAPSSTAALVLPVDDGATTVDSRFWSSVVEQGGGRFAGTVAELRRAGLLPAGNRSDPAAEIYHSLGGELLLEAKARRLSVVTTTLAGVCAPAFTAPQRVGALTVESASVAGSITAGSRDGQALERSARLLLVLATDARNSGARYRDQDGAMLEEQGGLPVLLRTGRFALRLSRAAGAPPLRAWALALDGSRRDELTVLKVDGGARLEVDTGALPAGATPFIELAER